MKKQIYILILLLLSSCHQEESTKVEIDVTVHVKDNRTSPLMVTVENNTRFAEEFLWTFEGGDPATSNKKNPGAVTFITPGEHTITLEAWNIAEQAVKTYTVQVDSAVVADFDIQADINNYAPATFIFNNRSVGGITYKWLFEGAQPETYEGKDPPAVTYSSQGSYTVILIVDNGSALTTVSKEVEVREPLDASFNILPSHEDIDDMEAPLRATFEIRLQGVESLQWECAGATITNAASVDASIYFPMSGQYTVYLEVSNGKETKRVSQQVTVKENSNLRTHKDIKLGISTAQFTVGTFYSTQLRQVIKGNEVNTANAPLIDIVYFGFDNTFSRNRFVSPDQLETTTFLEFDNARATKFINRLESGNIYISVQDFESMTTDALLKTLPISSANYGDEYFGDAPLPRVILFETSDGRKGAILVKNLVKANKEDSYIIADIKIQKND
jgi:PKD repeat protein